MQCAISKARVSAELRWEKKAKNQDKSETGVNHGLLLTRIKPVFSTVIKNLGFGIKKKNFLSFILYLLQATRLFVSYFTYPNVSATNPKMEITKLLPQSCREE